MNTENTPKILGLITPATFIDFENNHSDLTCCDLFEIRLDTFNGDLNPHLKQLSTQYPKIPWLLTDRLQRDGGHCPNEQSSQRLGRLLELSHFEQTQYIDLELEEPDSIRYIANKIHELKLEVQILASHHNFSNAYSMSEYQSKEDLAARLPIQALKFAVTFQNEGQEKELYKYIKSHHKTILLAAFSMGELGKRSRVFSPLCGAPFTYGYFGDTPSAPGQWSVKEMRDKFDFFKNSGNNPLESITKGF